VKVVIRKVVAVEKSTKLTIEEPLPQRYLAEHVNVGIRMNHTAIVGNVQIIQMLVLKKIIVVIPTANLLTGAIRLIQTKYGISVMFLFVDAPPLLQVKHVAVEKSARLTIEEQLARRLPV